MENIQRGWQFLLLRFKIKRDLNLFSEKCNVELRFGPLSKNNQKQEWKLPKFDPRGTYYISAGASVNHCIEFPNVQKQFNPYEITQRAAAGDPNSDFSFDGGPHLGANRDRARKRPNGYQNGEYFRGCVSLPLFLVGSDSLNDFLNENDTARGFSDALAEMIFNKQILNKKHIDVAPYIHRRQEFQQIVKDGTENLTMGSEKMSTKPLKVV